MRSPPPCRVLVVGGTGRTGRRVIEHLVGRGVDVRALVRSANKLPEVLRAMPNLAVVEADLLALPSAELQSHLAGCDAIVSCLGHVLSLRGVFGPPFDLVTRATANLCDAVETMKPRTPVKFILMTSVSVNHPQGIDGRRGRFERAFLWALRGVLPPARDNQRAADLLHDRFAPGHPFVAWVTLRPDTLLDGEVSAYTLHEALVNTLFAPGSTNMANIAHFVGDLVLEPEIWATWSGKQPVIVNAVATQGPRPSCLQ